MHRVLMWSTQESPGPKEAWSSRRCPSKIGNSRSLNCFCSWGAEVLCRTLKISIIIILNLAIDSYTYRTNYQQLISLIRPERSARLQQTFQDIITPKKPKPSTTPPDRVLVWWAHHHHTHQHFGSFGEDERHVFIYVWRWRVVRHTYGNDLLPQAIDIISCSSCANSGADRHARTHAPTACMRNCCWQKCQRTATTTTTSTAIYFVSFYVFFFVAGVAVELFLKLAGSCASKKEPFLRIQDAR